MSLKEKMPENHFEENLAAFAGLLRREGLPVGTTEVMDAMEALQRVDLSKREECRCALQAALVKSRRDQAVFNRVFDHFFVPPELHRSRAKEMSRRRRKLENEMEQAADELRFKGESLQLSSEELRQYSALSREQRGRLQEFLHKTETGKNVEPHFKPLLENIVKSHLRYCRSNYNSGKPEKRPSNSYSSGDGAGSGGGEDALREMDIQSIGTSELSAAEQLLKKLSRRLAFQILRRRRSGPRSGALDFRRSMRENMRFGGVIFKLKHRPRRRSKQQVLLLCDVSASMKRYSTFVIHFLHGLQEAIRDLSCFSFSDTLENLTPELQGRTGLRQLLDRVVRHSQTWGGGTNIGSSLKALRSKYPDLLNGRTTVIVVSDTKTVAIDTALKELQRLNDRVKRIIWLNPLPAEQWAEYRSTRSAAEMVEMWPCSTIAQLEEVIDGRL